MKLVIGVIGSLSLLLSLVWLVFMVLMIWPDVALGFHPNDQSMLEDVVFNGVLSLVGLGIGVFGVLMLRVSIKK